METQTTGRSAVGNDGSIRDLFSETVHHSKAYIAAERTALTLRARLTAKVLTLALAFGSAAAILALFGFGWLLVGLALLLAEAIGAIGAAFVVSLILLGLAFVCVLLARRALARLPRTSS